MLTSFPRLPVTSILPLTVPPVTSFRRHTQRKTWPNHSAFLPSVFPFIVCRILLYSSTLSNTYSFFTQSVLLIFSILLHYQVSKLSRYFEALKFQHHTKLYLKCSNLLLYNLNFKSNWLVKTVFFLLSAAFAMTNLDLTSRVHLHRLFLSYPNIWNIPHSPAVFDQS